jgi:tRNA-Thr(GGU) m(6)t(6)A37 methyltransferase TsaA
MLSWLHATERAVLKVRPGHDERRPITGVFATRSPDRPNPIGLHRLKVLGMETNQLYVNGLEAIDGTPIIDIKPVIERAEEF